MNTVVKAAAVQISPVLYSRQGTVEKIVKKVRELGKQDVQLATFPETVVPYYPYFSFVQPAFAIGKEHQRLLEQSVTVPSAETRAIGEAAKDANMVVSIGVNERDGGSIYNAQLLFDADGTLIQRRRKITPTYHERMIWGQGDGSGLRRRQCRGTDWTARLLGALPAARALRADCRWRADPLGDVSRIDLRSPVRGADGSQHPSAFAAQRPTASHNA